MHRMLERGQVENLASGKLAHVRPPQRDALFATRSRRLRTLSEGHAIGDYLCVMADLAQAQHEAIVRLPRSAAPLTERDAPGPPLHANHLRPHELARTVLSELCDSLLVRPVLPAQVRATCEQLRTLASNDVDQRRTDWLQPHAQALLAGEDAQIEAAAAPFCMAALQVCWTYFASEVKADRLPDQSIAHECPVCGAAPVASLILAGGAESGYRYLQCSLCSSEWHYVRACCTRCGSSKAVSYQSVEGAGQAVRAECCDECGVYRKVLNREHDPELDAIADDLASLPLDLLVGAAGYRRASNNPLLWQP